MLILRELLFRPSSRFTDLNIQGLTSDHFSYHINTLIQQKLVDKSDGVYSLTPKGKEYANQMDTDDAIMEKQPKVAVMLVASRMIDGKKHLLIQERTKEPYFGYYGFLTGKIRFGEMIHEAAKRELEEESGLTCTEVHLKNVVHDHVVLEDTGKLIEDKLFFIVSIPEPEGDVIDTDAGKNHWITEDEFYKLEKKYYNEDNIYELSKVAEDRDFNEKTYIVKEF